MEQDRYQNRWLSLFDPRIRRTPLVSAYNDLFRRYHEKHRAYHNWHHIRDCLNQFDAVRAELEQPFNVETALWFHDAIYDTHHPKNEENSAELAAEELSKLGLPGKIIDQVCRLILVTRHPSRPQNNDEAYMVDIDLSILGAAKEVFEHYESQIREEYHWVPLEIYRRERGRLLESFLTADRIFRTDRFHETCEKQARNNIQASLLRLNSGVTCES